MKKTFKLQLTVAALIAVVVLVAIAFAVGLSWGNRGDQERITASVLNQEIQAIGELATVEYHYTNMGKFENQLDFYGWPVPFTKKSFIVSYDGVIKAGIDVSQLHIKQQGEQLTISGLEAGILSHEIDFDSLTVFDETRNIFNPISITDYQRFSQDQQATMEQKVITGGLLTEAQQKAEQAITQLVRIISGDTELRLVFVWVQ